MLGIQLIYLLILFTIGVSAAASFWSMKKNKNRRSLRIKRNRYNQFIDYVKKRVDEKELNILFENSGLAFTAFTYQIIRYAIIIIWLVLLAIIYPLKGNELPILKILSLILLFTITSPTPYFFGKRTPFTWTMDVFKQNYKNKKNMEVYRAISQLKNMAITRKVNPMGADFIIEQLRNFSQTIRPSFNKMLGLWNMGRKEEACNYFERAIDTKEAKDLANLFRRLDDLSPDELLNQIILLQEGMKKERQTRKLTSNENKSSLVYFLVIITASIIMINFIVVVYFLETFQQLRFIH